MVILCKPTQAVCANGIPLCMTSRHVAIRIGKRLHALYPVLFVIWFAIRLLTITKRTSSAWGLPAYTCVSIIPMSTKTFSIICSPGSRLRIVYKLGNIQESVWHTVNLTTWFKLSYKLNHISPYTVSPNHGLYHWVVVNIRLKDQKMTKIQSFIISL